MRSSLPPIIIDPKNAQFFIAVCMVHGHTMITAGVRTKTPEGSSQTELLLDVGKSIVLEKRKQGMFTILWQMLWGSLDSTIQNERVFVDLKHEPVEGQEIVKRNIEYMAFAINYKNYLSLLAKLKKLNPEIKAYAPDESSTKENLILKFDSLNNIGVLEQEPVESADIDEIQRNKDKLSFQNHCRLDAQRLLHSTFPNTAMDDFGVSSSIQGHLLCRSSITNGIFDKELIILPPPPSSYNLGEKQTKVLNKLYSRIEKILALNQDDELTREKFEKTKTLYMSIVSKEKPSLDDVLSSIISWSQQNQELVDRHRRWWTFFQPTATRVFVDEVKKEKENNDSLERYLK